MSSFTKLQKTILEAEKILLISHESPDGDCLGSMTALAEALKQIGKEVVMSNKDQVPPTFKFIPHSGQIVTDFLIGEFGAVILIDNGDLKRTGFGERLAKLDQRRTPIINIDHHIKNDLWKLVRVNYADEKAPATAVIVYRIVKELGARITPTMATSLLAGIYTDTGGFQHTNTSSEVLEIVSDLLSCGAKLKLVSENISKEKSITRLKLWGIALSRLKINSEYGIIYSIITQKEIENLNASEDEVSGLVNLINSVPEAKISLLLYEDCTGKIKGSLRTDKALVDVSGLARLAGGGGHKKASGFVFPGKLVETTEGWRVE